MTVNLYFFEGKIETAVCIHALHATKQNAWGVFNLYIIKLFWQQKNLMKMYSEGTKLYVQILWNIRVKIWQVLDKERGYMSVYP